MTQLDQFIPNSFHFYKEYYARKNEPSESNRRTKKNWRQYNSATIQYQSRRSIQFREIIAQTKLIGLDRNHFFSVIFLFLSFFLLSIYFFFFGFVFRFCLLLLRFFLLLLQFCFLLLHCLLRCCLFGKCFRGMVQIFTFALEFVYRGNVGTHKQMGTERKERTKKTTAVAAAAAAATTTTTTKCCLCLIVPVNR